MPAVGDIASLQGSLLRGLARLRGWLDETLFLDGPAPPAQSPHRVAASVAIALVATALVILRIDHSAPLDSFWAEDGKIFYGTALMESSLSALFSTLSAYLVLIPRLIAEIALLFPVDLASGVFTVLAAGVAVGCGFVVWRASAAHIRNPWLRGVLAALVAFSPVAGLEAVATAAYVAWYMLSAAFWILLWRPVTFARALGGGTFLFATAMTTPLAGVMAPLALLRGVAIRDRRDVAIVGGFALGLVIQETTYLLNQGSDPTAPNPSWDAAVWKEYVQRVIGGASLGVDLSGSLWANAPVVFWATAIVAMGVLLALILVNPSPRVRWLGLGCIALSVLTLVAESYTRGLGDALAWPSGTYHDAEARYVMMPAVLLSSALMVGLGARPRRISARRWSIVRIAGCVLAVVAIGTSFGQSNPAVRADERWSSAVRDARRTCEMSNWQDVSIPTSPPGWGVLMPCAALR